MVIDSSALVAIILEEPDASIYLSAIANTSTALLSTATFVETSLVLLRRRKHDALTVLDIVISQLKIETVPVDHEQGLLAREAFLRFGKGRHKAGLNFGDCFSYALAKQTGEPILFKGNDFSKTDIVSA
jgi:ribonuclease VapC